MTPDDLPPLLPPSQSFVIDPVLADTVEAGMEVAALGQPTAGPNRLTMHVPKEMTQLSLGAASPQRWRTDLGIDGYTNSHVHFETKDEARTVVSLGGPATTSGTKGYGAAAPVATHGYSLVTENNAWHDAKKQHYLLSLAGDISLRTKGEGSRAVVQAEVGSVDIIGGQEVNIAGKGVAISAHPALPYQDVLYTKPWTGETPHSTAAHVTEAITTVVNGMVTVCGLVASARAIRKEMKPGLSALSVDKVADIVEWVADAGEFYNTCVEFKKLVSAEEAPKGEIKIDADADLGGAAGGQAAFFGLKSASMSTALWAGVNGVGLATMKGILFAGVVGSYVSCKGYKKIEIGCDHGDAHFDAAKGLTIASETADVILVGKKTAQVSSKQEAYFCSAKKTWVGTSAGPFWGALLHGNGLFLGKATDADKMVSGAVESSRSVKVTKKGMTLTSASTVMTHAKKKLTVSAGDVKFHAKDSDVKVDGKKVLIDA